MDENSADRREAIEALNKAALAVMELGLADLGEDKRKEVEGLLRSHVARAVMTVELLPLGVICTLHPVQNPQQYVEVFRVETQPDSGATRH